MTKVAMCRWCGGLLPPIGKTGRPRQFCKRSCRQRDFEARERARAHGLDEAELIITRAELEDLRDKLFVLQCAVQDVQRDLTASKTFTAYKDAVGWLIDSASPLRGTWPQRP